MTTETDADLTGKTWSCRFCRHVWRGRVPHPPVRCPSCMRTKWAAGAEAAATGLGASRSGAAQEEDTA